MNKKNIETIKSNLSWDKITDYYKTPFKRGKNSRCPFHKDKTASLSFHKTDQTFNCFGCDAKGDYLSFIALQENLDCKLEFMEVLRKAELIAGTNSLKEVRSELKVVIKEVNLLDSNIIEENHNQLLKNKEVVDWFVLERKIDIETLKKANIGFASHVQISGRSAIHFPYQSENGKFIHNRIRELGSNKNVMSQKGSTSSLYLAPNLLKSKKIFVTEGEIDALTIFQYTNNVVGVPGSQSFTENLVDSFAKIEEIIFCGDNDLAGRNFNEKSSNLIKNKYPHIAVSSIDWAGFPEKYDINDFHKSLKNPKTLVEELFARQIEKKILKITPMQYFDRNFACTTVHEEVIIDDKKDGKVLVSMPYLITSDRKKIPLKNDTLYENSLIAKRIPNPSNQWEHSSVERFLRGVHTRHSLRETFQKIEKELKKYLSFEEDRFYKLVPLWIIGTYFHRGMMTFPYLSLNGSKSCGKSKLLAFIGSMAFQSMINVGGTAASTIRLIHSNHITCCIDEAENLGNARDENVQALLSIYNSGYKEGANVTKCGFKNKVEIFDSYSPKVFAGIRGLNDTTASRCILINMPPVKNRKNFNCEISSRNDVFLAIKNQLYIHLLSDFKAVFKVYDEIVSPSEELNGRDWEMWKPLLTIASLIGRELTTTVTDLALDMTKNRKHSDFSSKDDIAFVEVVLSQLEKFESLKGFVPIVELKKALVSTEIDTFLEITESSGSNRWIGNWLKRMGLIKQFSVQKKVRGFNTRCYKINKTDLIHRLDALKGE